MVEDAPSEVRVFHPDDVHLTVAFLGSCGEERALAAWELVDPSHAAFQATLGALAPFGNPRRPSALSIELLDGREQAAALVVQLRGPMSRTAGLLEMDHRAPRPHITVARPARKATSEQRRRAVAWAKGKEPIEQSILIDRIALYTWSDERPAKQFRIVQEARLRDNEPR